MRRLLAGSEILIQEIHDEPLVRAERDTALEIGPEMEIELRFEGSGKHDLELDRGDDVRFAGHLEGAS